MKKWGGRKAQAWTASVLARYGRVCWLNLPGCTIVATTGDHVIPRHDRPDLELVVENGRPACEPCNKRRKRAAAPRRELVDDRAFFESAHPARSDSAQSPPRVLRKNRDERTTA